MTVFARLALAACVLGSVIAAPFRLASIFGPGMVLQRNQEVTFWGTARSGATVYASFMNSATNETLQGSGAADASGAWQVSFPARPASGPVWRLLLSSSPVDLQRCDAFQFYCSGASAAISSISFGDVHLCIGQVRGAAGSSLAAGCSGARVSPACSRHSPSPYSSDIWISRSQTCR